MSNCLSNVENVMSATTSLEDAQPMWNQIRVKKKVGTRSSTLGKSKSRLVQMEEDLRSPLSNPLPEWIKK